MIYNNTHRHSCGLFTGHLNHSACYGYRTSYPCHSQFGVFACIRDTRHKNRLSCNAARGINTWPLCHYIAFGGCSAPWIAVQAVGLQAVLICVIRDWSPLVRLKEVLQTKNADSLSAPMSIAGCFDCALWAIFGKMGMDDAPVYVPNTIRLGFTALQVVLLAMYGSWAREKRKIDQRKGVFEAK